MNVGGTTGTRPWESLFVAAAVGLVAAMVAGGLWYLLVVGTKSSLMYLSLGLGAVSGVVVSAWSRRRGLQVAMVAAVVCALALLIMLFYVNRYLFIRSELLAGRDLDVPAMPSVGWFRLVVVEGFKARPAQLIYVAVSIAIAAWFGNHGVDRHMLRPRR